MDNQALRSLRNLVESLGDNKLIKKGDVANESFEVEFKMESPAKEEEIRDVEKQLGVKLPCSFKEFLKTYNGGEMYNFEYIDGYKFFGTGELCSENKRMIDEYKNDWLNDIIIFAECLGEGNYLGFRAYPDDIYPVIDCFHEVTPSEWRVIENSFDNFLEKLIKNNGNKYWLV